jgi:antitoxin component of RelBE/YafQ-DinJ toxin-antitoxin module
METRSTRTHFQTKLQDGLFELVHRAAKAAASSELDSGGLLEIRAAGGSTEDGHPLAVTAQFSDDGLRRTIAKLDIHVGIEAEDADPSLVERVVATFGSPKLTNLCFAAPLTHPEEDDDLELLRPRAAADDALDITVDCSSSVPFFANNLALVSSRLDAEELEAAADCLKRLGVGFSRAKKTTVRVSRFQLRLPVRPSAQAAAFSALVRRGMSVSLYSATIPATQSVRIAWRVRPNPSGGQSWTLELCISRGLAGVEGTTKEHVVAIDTFIRKHFGVEVAEGEWTVESRKWTTGSEPEIEKKAGA